MVYTASPRSTGSHLVLEQQPAHLKQEEPLLLGQIAAVDANHEALLRDLLHVLRADGVCLERFEQARLHRRRLRKRSVGEWSRRVAKAPPSITSRRATADGSPSSREKPRWLESCLLCCCWRRVFSTAAGYCVDVKGYCVD
eukprot:7015989-Pyramimonas_sp.AAC.1